MTWVIRFSKRVEKYLKNEPREISNRILSKISLLKDDPWALPYEKLKGHESFYRIRVGDFRIIYYVDKNEKEVYIVKIERRERAYKKL